MKKILIAIILSLSPFAFGSTGRRPPTRLSYGKIEVAKQIITHLKKKHPKENAVHIVALGLVESGLTNAVNRSGDYGYLQVNCHIWSRRLQKVHGVSNCAHDMLTLHRNVDAAVYILQRFRRYKACKGDNLYACYNGGQRWVPSGAACLKRCKNKCRSCTRPARHASTVRRHINFLRRRYAHLFN